ncbi:Dihydroxy-acid dehydratase [Sporomusa carbonis]|uniref:dihydroxy-acid dehydratase n=1 Tax=Sporomusa carbonis TaxID=3076075 RepID=UPI003A615791
METSINKLPPYQRAIAKGHLGSCGAAYRDLNRPIIAVVNSWNEIVPGHCHLRGLAGHVKEGILAAGGFPLEFNTIAICDGIAQGHEGMKYVLPSRELIADSVETMIRAHGIFDGMVMLASCDKIVPAMLMAAGRLNLPTVLLTGGPMINRIAPAESKKARQKFIKGEIDEQALFDVTVEYYPTAGVCPFLGTANTMCVVAEALGMTLPGSSTLPATSAERQELARKTGATAVELVKKGVSARDILTQDAFENAIAVVLAMGGSLNTVLHLPAIAHECGLAVTYQDFDRVSRITPLITRVTPNSQEYTVADLHEAGGLNTIMNELKPVLHTDVVTVTGRTLAAIIATASQADGKVVRSFEQPFSSEGGLAVLAGNLAPEGAIVKSSAVPEDLRVFQGPAKVFDAEEECMAAIETGKIQSGDVLVIRYEGPVGGPGMREMHRITEVAAQIGRVAIITDGRFSGASAGLSIGYLSPEAAEGGPIAWVEDGDLITIDIDKRTIQWHVTEQELAARQTKQKVQGGQECESLLLNLYRQHATSSAQGAVRRLTRPEVEER